MVDLGLQQESCASYWPEAHSLMVEQSAASAMRPLGNPKRWQVAHVLALCVHNQAAPGALEISRVKILASIDLEPLLGARGGIAAKSRYLNLSNRDKRRSDSLHPCPRCRVTVDLHRKRSVGKSTL